MYPQTIIQPHIYLSSPVKKKSNKDLYHFCLLFCLCSTIGFTCNYLVAQVVTSILHSGETKLDSVHWYWNRYASILRMLFGISGIISLLYIIYIKKQKA